MSQLLSIFVQPASLAGYIFAFASELARRLAHKRRRRKLEILFVSLTVLGLAAGLTVAYRFGVSSPTSNGAINLGDIRQSSSAPQSVNAVGVNSNITVVNTGSKPEGKNNDERKAPQK